MSEIKLIYLFVYYPFKVPWMNLGLQNLGANIQAMTQNIVANSINQAQSSFQAGIADKIRRAEAAGTTFDFSELRPGEFRQFTDREGNTRGFSHRYGSGILKKAQCWLRTHLQAKCSRNSLIMPPTSKTLTEHIGFGLCVRPCVRPFEICMPYLMNRAF